MSDFCIWSWLETLASERKFFTQKRQPSLDQVHRALDLLDRPDKSFVTRVVIGGTAGKGTTCRYIEQTLLSAGKTVVCLSSPHLQVVHERIRINGQLVANQDLERGLLKLKKLIEEHDLVLTYYEVLVITGICLASQAGIEVLICEVGIGGEMDAVNAVQGPRLAGLTFVGEDHLEMFGNSLEKLVEAKAGIFTNECIFGASFDQKNRSIINKKSNIKIEYIKGIKQKLNKKLARKICEKILGNMAFEMTKPKLPCRWEKVSEKVILDGAHSGPRFEYILPKIKKLPRPRLAVLGLGRNHEPDIFEIILPEFDRVIWSEVPVERLTWKASDLVQKFGLGECIPNPDQALEKALDWQQKTKGQVFINGLFLGGAVRSKFYSPQNMIEQQTEWPE